MRNSLLHGATSRPRRSAMVLSLVAGSVLVLAGVMLTQPQKAVVLLDPKVTVTTADLEKQNPIWAESAVPKLSKGFNAWMDTLPFGDNYHKMLADRKAKQVGIEVVRLLCAGCQTPCT
eukprot:3104093-Rhodomonas_salina.1